MLFGYVYKSIWVESVLIITDGNPAAVLRDVGCEEEELKERQNTIFFYNSLVFISYIYGVHTMRGYPIIMLSGNMIAMVVHW